MTIPSFSQQRTSLITWSLLCLLPIIGMVVDVISPSLPSMANDLQASRGLIKFTITLYLFGYAIGNFLTGFLSDAWGRRKLLHTGIVSFIFLSLLPYFFPHLEIVFFVRALQGISTGNIATAVRAILTDTLPSEKMTHMGTLLGTMWGIGPVIGPVIGGYLEFYP